jgi:hypothetical protein
VSERRARCQNQTEDFFFHENSHLYPIQQRQAIPLQSTHVMKSIKASGIMLGLPYNRPRCLAFGFDARKFVWTGGEDPQLEFEFIFARSLQLTGDAYFIAPQSEVQAEYSTIAHGRGHSLPDEYKFDDISVLTKILSPGTMDRLFEWQDKREGLQSPAGVFIADLEHHPDTRGPVAGPVFPTMVTHSTIFSYSERRLHLGIEGFAVHGVHLYPEQCGNSSKCHFEHVLRRLTRRQQAMLVGNSLLCPLVGAWVFYCLANLHPKSFEAPQPSLGEGGGDDDADV